MDGEGEVQGEGTLGNLRPRSEAVKEIVKKREAAKAEGKLVESPEEQKIRHGENYVEALKTQKEKTKEQASEPIQTETPSITKEAETDKMYDVFFVDKGTVSPNRLNKNIGKDDKGDPQTEPVILPQIPDNWIVKVPVGLYGGEAHYRPSSPKNAEEAKKRIGLGNITSSNREIMILEVVLKDEISDLEEKDYKVVPIDEITQKLRATEKVELPIAA